MTKVPYTNRQLTLLQARDKVRPGMTTLQFAELALECSAAGMYLFELELTMFRLGWRTQSREPRAVIVATLHAVMGSALSPKHPGSNRSKIRQESVGPAQTYYIHVKFIHGRHRKSFAYSSAA